MKSYLSILVSLLCMAAASAQDRYDGPIIDMHIHAYIPGSISQLDFEWVPDGIEVAKTGEGLLHDTLSEMQRLNVVKAWASGPTDVVLQWKQAAPRHVYRINGVFCS